MAGSSTNKAKAKASHKDRQSRSRNTTPLSSTSVSVHIDVKHETAARHTLERSTSPYISTSLSHPPRLTHRWSDTPLADLFDEHAPAGATASTIPSVRALNAIWEKIESHIWPAFKDREDKSHELMSEVAGKQKERIERDHQRGLEKARRDAEEKRQQQKKKNNNSTPKKADREEVRPPTVGSHGVARQDGKESMREHSSPMSSIDSRPPSNPDTTMEDAGEKASDSEADEQRQPPPAATIPQFQIFGDDPSQFPDDTIYEVLEITDDMTDEEKKAIYSVARFPASDLRDKIAGIPPDRDFSNAKPTNQVAAQTFANFVEPYLRPLTQEDLGFLQERDRVHVFELPKKGRHYKEVWAEEDGTNFLDQEALKLSTNEPRGSIDLMNDDVAESDEVSAGPITARWLALSRPITRPGQDENLTNGLGTEMEIDNDNNDDQKNESQTPATAFPESTWKNVPHAATSDFGSQESRLLEELRHIGFLSATDLPSFAEQQDDEVSARLRYLQRELHRISLINGARKARVAEIADGRMAAQEWQGISDDLDEQLKQAYLKRNRNIGKGKKQMKRPGTAAPVGLARAGAAVGEPIRSLVERRAQWNDLIGPVVDHGQVSVPKDSIFDKENMDKLIKLEQENWIDTSEEV